MNTTKDRGDVSMAVYLLHFEEPYHHARHYLGWATNVQRRLEEHRRGSGARLMEVIGQERIAWWLVRTWQGGYDLERQFKRWHNGPQLCPICNPALSALVEEEVCMGKEVPRKCQDLGHNWQLTTSAGWFQCARVVDVQPIKRREASGLLKLARCGMVAHCPGCLGCVLAGVLVVFCTEHVASNQLEHFPVHDAGAPSESAAPVADQMSLW